MNKLTFSLLLHFLILTTNASLVFGQCLPDGISFNSQSQIDNFPTDYPGCTEITGYVFISGNINNLNGLSQITAIGDFLKINNSTLENLDGLENLQAIDELLLEDNEDLENINALANLSSVNRILVWNNDSLLSLSGLEGITNISGEISIQQNNVLESLMGLQNLTNIGNDCSIYLNPQLNDLSGLASLIDIGDSFTIGENMSLNTLEGLDNLSEIGGNFTLNINPQLSSIQNLQSLTSINGYFLIQNETSLLNLNGLENLTQISGVLNIGVNNLLINIDGIRNIDASTITELQIFQNGNLSECAVQSVCDFLEIDPMNAVIDANLAGCNSVQEVQDACALGTEENQLSEIKIFPNPTNGTFEIAGLNNGSVSIIDSQGRTVKQMNLGQTDYSISELTSGIYFVKITSENSSLTKQLIKI